MPKEPDIPREGALYKQITVAGHAFELRYGYYQAQEREICPPVVIFPDLTQNKKYCPDGNPLVTQIQDPCEYYRSLSTPPENWCGDCCHFSSQHPEIGICRCKNHKLA